MPLWPVALPLLRVDLLGEVLDARTAGLLFRSLWMSLAAGLLALLLGWPSAVLATRSDAPGSTLFRTLLPLPLLLPPLMVAQAWFGLTGMSGPWAAVATFGVVAIIVRVGTGRGGTGWVVGVSKSIAIVVFTVAC